MSYRTRKIKGRIIRPFPKSVLFEALGKTTFLPKSVRLERADGRARFAPGEVTAHVPSKMAERKFGPRKG